MNLLVYFRESLQTLPNWFRRHLLESAETPHRLALGVGIGLFVAFTPLFGVQMLVAVLLAWLLGGNKILAAGMVWVSNPFTVVPIYYPSYWLGCWLLGLPVREQLWVQVGRHMTWTERVLVFYDTGMRIMKPLWLGTLLLGSVAGVVGYILVRSALWWYQRVIPGAPPPPV